MGTPPLKERHFYWLVGAWLFSYLLFTAFLFPILGAIFFFAFLFRCALAAVGLILVGYGVVVTWKNASRECEWLRSLVHLLGRGAGRPTLDQRPSSSKPRW